jgi:hypothetical protein
VAKYFKNYAKHKLNMVSEELENKQRLQQLANLEGMVYNKLDGVVRIFKISSLFSEIAQVARVVAEMKKGNSLQNCLFRFL